MPPSKKLRSDFDDLPWQDSGFGMGDELMLEEVEGVQVTYEQTANGGKVAKFSVRLSTFLLSDRTYPVQSSDGRKTLIV